MNEYPSLYALSHEQIFCLSSMEITSFITAWGQCPCKNPFISRLSCKIFIHTCIFIIIQMFTKMICIFAHAPFSHTRWDQANIDIWKRCVHQCFTFILMVHQMLFISQGVVPYMGLTPHKQAIFVWGRHWGWLARPLSKF